MDLRELYRHRFDETDRARKAAIWRVLYRDVFGRWIRREDTVLDLGAGFCEFINAARAARRIAVDLNPDTSRLAAPGVEVHQSSASKLDFLAAESVDVVFSSNFLEHLPDKEQVLEVLQEALRVLRVGGILMLLGPNVRLVPGAYWDFFDHHVPLSERSLCEALTMSGFELAEVQARFLPYTTRSALPQAAWLVALYLKLRPLSSGILGKQFLIIARKPAAAAPRARG
jgi:SAM-dependent methyltransferase